MKYFIGYAISGEAKDYLYNLTKEISEKYDTWPLHEKIPPHLTIYRPFDSEDLELVRSVLKEMKGKVDGHFLLSNFNRFEDKVVFVDVEVDDVTKDAVLNLRKELQHLPNMQIEDFPDWHPHATIANHLPAEIILQIWEYVSGLERPNYSLRFDNVCIFRSEGGKKWVIEESFPV